MALKWKSSKFKGVRFRLHPSRKHGATPDRYYSVRYQLEGQRKEEGLGWASQGWSEQKAALKLAELKEAAKTGQGPARLSEARAIAKEKRQAQKAEQERRKREQTTLAEFWVSTYFPSMLDNKTKATIKRERCLFNRWLKTYLGDKPLSEISPLDLERLKRSMVQAGRSPRTVQLCLATVRQVFNHAKRLGIWTGVDPPTKAVKVKMNDNRRLRFLTREEADLLLDTLHAKSPDLAGMALVSLHSGCRAGELFKLRWKDVDLDRGILTLRDTKSGRTRYAHLTSSALAMLKNRQRGHPENLVFPAKGGGQRESVSKVFREVVNDLGLNRGVTDRRDKIVFHSLRHTFASWLVQAGTPLYVVKEALGHKTLAMTERYSHLAPDHLAQTVDVIESGDSAHARQRMVDAQADG